MSSARHANFNRALVLSLLMMMMTQVGYLESMNPWTSDEETLDETNEVLETGGSGSSFAYANNKVANGADHSCAILDNGDLKCWGFDSYGQLGDGGNQHQPRFTRCCLRQQHLGFLNWTEQRHDQRHQCNLVHDFTRPSTWTVHRQQHVHHQRYTSS